MMYCNHNCTGFFGFNCVFRTSDGYCNLSQCVSYSDKTEERQSVSLYDVVDDIDDKYMREK